MRRNFRQNISLNSSYTNSVFNDTTISRNKSNNSTIITSAITNHNLGIQNTSFSNKESDLSDFTDHAKSNFRTKYSNLKTENSNLNVLNDQLVLNNKKNNLLSSSNLKTISKVKSNNKIELQKDGKNSEIKSRTIKIRNSTAFKNSFKFEQEYLISIIENFAREVNFMFYNFILNY